MRTRRPGYLETTHGVAEPIADDDSSSTSTPADLGEDTTLRDDGETAILSATAPVAPVFVPPLLLIPESDTSVMGPV